MDNKKKKHIKIEGLKEEEEGKKEAEIIMNRELELATELAKNDELDRYYFDKFPPGYRFHPTPTELIIHYLKNKVLNLPMPLNRIRDVNLYRFHPHQLSNMYKMHREKKLYFFTPRTKKYPNGSRPDRAAGKGYWKATGADKKIKSNGNLVGLQKTLVYFEGRAKDRSGKKTNWIMHEYKMAPKNEDNAAGSSHAVSGVLNNANTSTRNSSTRPPKDKKLGDWVLCMIYLKPAKQDRKQDAMEEPNDILEEGIVSDSIDYTDEKVLNPDPVQYWSSRNMANVPVISQQVSNSSIIVHEEGQGFQRNMENNITIYEQVFNPAVPVRWDSSRIMMNVPVMNNQQLPNPTLVQHEQVLINPVRGEWGFGNVANAPRNNQQVSDSTDLVQGQQGLMTSMENLNYEQDSNWINPSASELPYLMNYQSTRFLPAANYHDAPFMYNNIHHMSGSQDFPPHNNSGVVAGCSSLDLDCEELYDPCNEYMEIANFPGCY